MSLFSQRIFRWRLQAPAPFEHGTRLKAGATFARMTAHQVVETARIVSVETRGGGVPHVRYNSCLHRANRVFEDGPRTLAVATFLERFESLDPADHRPDTPRP